MQLEDTVLSEVSQAQRPHVFPHMRKIESKDKPIQKNKHDHIQTQM
jgi:hypothetical protein